MTIEELIKALQKYPMDSNISIWQDDIQQITENITITYNLNNNEVILF